MGVFKLCLSRSVGIQVSCSAEDHSTVWDGRFSVSKYSKTSLYIAGHLPYLDISRNQASNQVTFPLYPSYLAINQDEEREKPEDESDKENLDLVMENGR